MVWSVPYFIIIIGSIQLIYTIYGSLGGRRLLAEWVYLLRSVLL
jgi:hypothetical protein